ncbi:hypothetical protein BMAJHU_0710, partial [Burkholderia mallei JHU]
ARGGGCGRARLLAATIAVDVGEQIELGRQILGARPAGEAIAREIHHEIALLDDRRRAALEVEKVIPAIRMEHVGQQRRAEQRAHLLARHADLQLRRLFLRHEVALDDGDPIRRNALRDPLGHAVVRRTGGQSDHGDSCDDGAPHAAPLKLQKRSWNHVPHRAGPCPRPRENVTDD